MSEVLITSLHSVRGRAGEANDKFFEDVMETIVVNIDQM